MTDNTSKAAQNAAELEWIKFREDTLGAQAYAPANHESKYWRKIKENPIVPIGALATVVALSLGLRSFHKGNTKQSQTMMRARVLAQGFTIVAMLGGMIIGATPNSQGEKITTPTKPDVP